MTTSEYLQVQADVLIAFRLMRLARVEEALRLARASVAAGQPLRDSYGAEVATDPERMIVLLEAAVGLLEKTGRDVIPQKGPVSVESDIEDRRRWA